MKTKQKLSVGSLFFTIGAIGIILGPIFGFSDIARPWSFILGFIFGLMAGIGAVLVISGFLERGKKIQAF